MPGGAALLAFFYPSGFIGEFSHGLIMTRLGLLDGRAAHLAVIVFFVLSGFLIAQSAARPGMTWTRYFQARLAACIRCWFRPCCWWQ